MLRAAILSQTFSWRASAVHVRVHSRRVGIEGGGEGRKAALLRAARAEQPRFRSIELLSLQRVHIV